MTGNLLPSSVKNRRAVVGRARWWICVWALAGITIGGYWFHLKQQSVKLISQKAFVDAIAAPLRDLKKQQREVDSTIKTTRQRESLLTDSDSGQSLQLLGLCSQAAANDHGRIKIDSFELGQIERQLVDLSEKKSRKRNKKLEYESRMQLTLDGVGIDDVAVAKFIAALRDSGVFETVELRSTISHVEKNHDTRLYRVVCVY